MNCSYISATQFFFLKFKIQMEALSFRDYLKLNFFEASALSHKSKVADDRQLSH